MLGQFTSCLSCDGAAIDPEKLNKVIGSSRDELGAYSEDSGEYQVVKFQIDEMVSYKEKFFKEGGE